MKKLLVLSLVLGIASLATAGMTISVDKDVLLPGEVATVTISNDVSSNTLSYLVVADDGSVGAVSNPTMLITLGALAGASPYTEAGFGTGYEITTAADAPALPQAGQQWSFSFSSALEGISNIQLFDDNLGYDAPASAVQVTVIPEPATMALLGLGALVLRRKK